MGPASALFLRREGPAGVEYVANRDVTYRFFAPGLRRAPVARPFAAAKAPQTVRIFALGESTLVGFPNPPGTGFPSFLEPMLDDAFPERRFEVVNCGITAVNSHCVLDFAREVLDYGADLLVVYCGHNEFNGPYGPTTPFVRVGNWRPLIRAHMQLQRSRLYAVFKELALGLPRRLGRAPAAFGPQLVTAEIGVLDPAYARTVANYRANLDDLVAAASARGVPIVLATLVSNLKDFYPLRSACAEEDGPDGVLLSQEVAGLKRQGAAAAALARVRAALQAAPECAAAHFELGRLHLEAGRRREALAAFVQARDFDRLPFRGPSILSQVVRQVARQDGATLCDVEAAFAAATPDGIVGDELLTEYLHPTVLGHYVLARTLVADLVNSPAAALWGRAQPDSVRSFDEYRARLGQTDLEAALAANGLILFLINLPYRSPPALLRERVADLIEAQAGAFARLRAADRDVFRGQGGLEFLERASAFAPADRQARLRALVRL